MFCNKLLHFSISQAQVKVCFFSIFPVHYYKEPKKNIRKLFSLRFQTCMCCTWWLFCNLCFVMYFIRIHFLYFLFCAVSIIQSWQNTTRACQRSSLLATSHSLSIPFLLFKSSHIFHHIFVNHLFHFYLHEDCFGKSRKKYVKFFQNFLQKFYRNFYGIKKNNDN